MTKKLTAFCVFIIQTNTARCNNLFHVTFPIIIKQREHKKQLLPMPEQYNTR